MQCIFSPVFATETRITQLFITNGGQEYRHTFLYDDFGYVRLETKYILPDNDTLRHSQIEWTRSASVVTQRERVFENNAWRDIHLIETQYNAQGLRIEESFFQYVSGVRTPVKRVQYEYQNGGLVEFREFRFENNVWLPALVNWFNRNNNVLTQRTTGISTAFVSRITYDTQGRPQAMLVQREIGSELHNTDSITWFYNDNGQLFSQRSRRWNEQGGYWENSQKVNFEYDLAGNLIAETYLQWSGMHWQNIYRREFQYNENNVQIRRTLQGHIHRDWRNMISIHYSDIHNGRARKMESRFDFWGGNTGELTPSYIPFYFNNKLVIRRAERIIVSFEELPPTTLPEINLPDELVIRVYPNPSDGRFYLNSAQHEILSWRVFSLTGQPVKSDAQRTHSTVIDLTGLPTGVYVLQVQTTIGTQQQRLVKR